MNNPYTIDKENMTITLHEGKWMGSYVINNPFLDLHFKCKGYRFIYNGQDVTNEVPEPMPLILEDFVQ